MNELNLDELLPEPRTVTLNGKEYECKHPTVEQMLRISDLEVKLGDVKSADEAMSLIYKTIEPVVPDIKNMTLTREQLIGLISFLITGTKPERLQKADGITPKKKLDSQKQ
jgi:hypothetical protein